MKMRGYALGAVLIVTVLCSYVTAQEKRPTAREVIAAIQEHVGVPWKTETVDTFKAGNPDTRVTGIAVTMMATMDVLRRAAAKGERAGTGKEARRPGKGEHVPGRCAPGVPGGTDTLGP